MPGSDVSLDFREEAGQEFAAPSQRRRLATPGVSAEHSRRMAGAVEFLPNLDAASLDAMTVTMDSALGPASDSGGSVASLAGGVSLAFAGQTQGGGLRIDFAVLVANASSV